MAVITKRSEIIFLYDATNCNPNGDPMDANRPRINEETGKCLVTDVYLKEPSEITYTKKAIMEKKPML
jgi:CRISPR-associated protein Csh2